MTSDTMRKMLAVLVLVGFVACVEVDPGIEVAVEIETQVETGAPLINNLGYDIELSRAYIVLSSFELGLCTEANFWSRVWRVVSPIGVAHAHTASSPFRSGSPFIEDLKTPVSTSRLIGIVEPPPGDYCTLDINFSPADSDAEGMPEATDMTGWTLMFKGTATPQDGGPPIPFLIQSADIDQKRVYIHTGTSSLELSEAVRSATISLGFDREVLFEDVDFATMDADTLAALVMTNTLVALRQR